MATVAYACCLTSRNPGASAVGTKIRLQHALHWQPDAACHAATAQLVPDQYAMRGQAHVRVLVRILSLPYVLRRRVRQVAVPREVSDHAAAQFLVRDPAVACGFAESEGQGDLYAGHARMVRWPLCCVHATGCENAR